MTRNNADFQDGQGFQFLHEKGSKIVLQKNNEDLSRLEYQITGPKSIYVSWLRTPEEHQEKGYGSMVTDYLYRQYPNHTIDFGDVVHPASEKIMDKMGDKYGRTEYSSRASDWTCKDCGEEIWSRDMLREHEDETGHG